MKQVYVRLFGGMGNQLFQYACARAVALRNDAELVLDSRQTDARGGHWTYALDHFQISARRGSEAELPPAKSRKLAYAAWRLLQRPPRFVRETGLGVNANILTLGSTCYLHGYFQSERYFADHVDHIRADLSFRTPASLENQKWMAEIRGANAVSLHLRRGDYMANSKGTYATCDAQYYARALDQLGKVGVNDPTIFIFSDDPDWARENLSLPCETRIVDCNDGAHAYEDLRLIAACKHNITANSTFSWWGAWLNANTDKRVIAPQNWFAADKPQNPDILPQGWIAL